jgi:hypothetical protein
MKMWIVTTLDCCEPHECVDCDRITRLANNCPTLLEAKRVVTLEDYQQANPKRPTGNEVKEIYIEA